ncbi:hypothetical protein [uncultured Pseudodesulfovibrio sp.]|uniref:hypothetical protein n=1 Tax=uncultured Pseudodesulfovibrio sp. TaxID=2035858 RepID=UPI0029C87C5F|nr:hypothetical protein [uncultured Pseudodesulfovibrio sp.]
MKATSFFYNALRTGIYMLPLAILCTALLTVSPALAGEEDGAPEVKLSVKPASLAKDVETGLDHLFEVLNNTSASFDTSKIGPMLDFVSATQDPKDIAPAKRFKGHGICLKQDVSSDLSTILRYFYNPEIPNYLLCPAVLRLSGWKDGSELLTRDTPLWDELETLDQPVLVRGKEFEVNTPDAFAEAYYRYDLKRLIILLKYNGKNVAISISEQADKSDVGRKGAILNDKEWEYFYSGIEGLNKGLIGWMDSFMYKSASVQIFMENDAAAPNSSVFLFKWLNAGWAGMNVVKRSHIYDGSLRYARSFVKVLESATLTPEEVADNLKDVRTLSTPEIDSLIKEYSKNFEIRFKDNPKLKSREYAKVIKDGKYYEVLDADARKSVLALEKLKCLMNMDTLLDLCASPVAEAEN